MNPSPDECQMYRESLDYVISNLKLSLVHHRARVDGTMMRAWEQERDLIRGQLRVLDRFSGESEDVRQARGKLHHDLEKTEQMMNAANDQQEQQRLSGVDQMHKSYVRALESLIPILNQQCPNIKWD